MALKNDGTVICWGGNYYGQTDIPAGLRNVAILASGCAAGHTVVGYHPVLLPVLSANGIATGTFSGDGSGLTSLNAAQISSGTIAMAQLPTGLLTNNATG